jgi:hypothetical protein
LADQHRDVYVEPSKGKGRSAIGFGGDGASLKGRLDSVVWAYTQGHEIASHANGHYDGSRYSQKQWDYEFEQFIYLVENSWKNYSSPHIPKIWKPLISSIHGFRAPQLGVGAGLWPSLRKNGYTYDTSRVNKMNYWPEKIAGIWNYPLAGLKIHGTNIKTLSMDYNFYFSHSKAKRGNPNDFEKFENQMYYSYLNYFNNNYYGNRAPIDIGHHFSKWNGGAYWKAMKRFAQTICKLPEVQCVTYQTLTNFLNSKSAAELAAFQRGDFPAYKQPNMNLQRFDSNSSVDFGFEEFEPMAGESVENELSDQELLELQEQLPMHNLIHAEEE